jgi:hypothetical protein
MLSCNWFKTFRRIVLTLALALIMASTVTPPSPPDQPTLPIKPQVNHPVTPQVNWGS